MRAGRRREARAVLAAFVLLPVIVAGSARADEAVIEALGAALEACLTYMASTDDDARNTFKGWNVREERRLCLPPRDCGERTATTTISGHSARVHVTADVAAPWGTGTRGHAVPEGVRSCHTFDGETLDAVPEERRRTAWKSAYRALLSDARLVEPPPEALPGDPDDWREVDLHQRRVYGCDPRGRPFTLHTPIPLAGTSFLPVDPEVYASVVCAAR